jgi:tRNA dimethylallyltransferase
VAGPTGAGKSLFAVELAIRLNGEILGADAYQVYAGMPLLTAQPNRELLAEVPHHLIGELPASESFDAATFADLARSKIAEITARGRVPILAGGAGLYLKALTHGLAELPTPDPALRAELTALPLATLQERLEALDPSARELIDFHNARRVARALEIVLLTGRSTAEQRREWGPRETPGFRGLLVTRGREDLNARIAENVREMFRQGVMDEVRGLGVVSKTAEMAIGLRDIRAHLRGEITLEECQENMIKATRRYAKRQLTWFRNQFNFWPIDLTGLQHRHDLPVSTALEYLGTA